MPSSVFDLFSIGIGPSSSHTLGPMRAAHHFAGQLRSRGILSQCSRVTCDLYGSLALTGRGHCTDKAILAGLAGRQAHDIAPGELAAIAAAAEQQGMLTLTGEHPCPFQLATDITFRGTERLPAHANGLQLRAFDANSVLLHDAIYYSVGGGFVVDADGNSITESAGAPQPSYPYTTAEALLSACTERGLRIADLVREWERTLRSDTEIREGMLRIAAVMNACIDSGLHTEGHLPGGLHVRRRAPGLFRQLQQGVAAGGALGAESMDWLSAYAIAVNEENASMGRVVTAPTNGAAGVVPAVLRYFQDHVCAPDDQARRDDGAVEFLLVAGAIGILYKEGASLSGAEVGCQGEVGVACSMAAGALASVLGGTNAQVENAAEIGMEHNLGLTCDPIGGLVQIPCIERNSMGAVKAVNAARLALHADGTHVVSLDRVIATMRRTGEDMSAHYKETSLAGLAVAVALPEC